MVATYVSASSSLGTKYRIAYNFKVGAKYIITVNAAEKTSTQGQTTGPNLRLDLTDNAGGGSQSCNGAGTITGNLSGNPAPYLLSSITYSDYQFVWGTNLTTTYATLEVSSIPSINGGTNAIRIKKITIAETVTTPPTPAFTLTPASVPIICGSSLPVTFTVNNEGSPTGIIDYTWNLGATPNGWLLPNGIPAPAIYPTGVVNTLMLTPDCGSIQKNVLATVTANGNSYNTNTSTVSITQPTLSINGGSAVCSGSGNYSITGLPCNALVTWSITPATGIANLSCSLCPTTALSFVSNGTVTLTANISNACGISSVISKQITIGNAIPGGTSSISSNCGSNYFNVLNTSLSAVCTANTYIYFYYNVSDSRFSNFVWTPVSVPSGSNWSGTGPNLVMGVKTPASQGSISETIALSATGPCGVYNVNFISTAAYVGGFRFSTSPNPSKYNVTITSSNKTLSKSSFPDLMYAIKITDQSGTLKKSLEYKSGITSTNISLTDLESGVYLISVFDGSKWSSKQLVIQK